MESIYQKLRTLYGEQADITISEPEGTEERHYRVLTASGIAAFFVVPKQDIQIHGLQIIAENILTYRATAELPS